jgi:hypothetical protein
MRMFVGRDDHRTVMARRGGFRQDTRPAARRAASWLWPLRGHRVGIAPRTHPYGMPAAPGSPIGMSDGGIVP